MSVRTELDLLVSQGLVQRVKHSNLPLAIYNYTDKCTITDFQNIPLLELARGLIIDLSDDLIVARAMPKIYALGELPAASADVLRLEDGYHAYERTDGTFCNAFNYRDKWMIATRNSFDCPDETEMLKKYRVKNWKNTNNYILSYQAGKQMVMITGYKVNDGLELGRDYSRQYAGNSGMRIPQYIPIDLAGLVDKPIRQDIIIKLASGLRVKIAGKAQEYSGEVQMSIPTIWEPTTVSDSEPYTYTISNNIFI